MDYSTCHLQVLRGESDAVGAACWGHSPGLRMSVRDGAATMATNAGGGGGGGPANPNDQDGRSYILQIYPRLAAQPSTCCNLKWVFHGVAGINSFFFFFFLAVVMLEKDHFI